MKNVLDARTLKKGKYEFLVLWEGTTVANDTWVAEEHFPESKKDYLLKFCQIHQELFGKKKKNKKG
jgi:hypothetical protein